MVSAAPVLQVRQLRFRWQPALPPCLDIDEFSVQAGERLFLHGPSGSGKSTLLGLLGGVLVPGSGSVRALGQELSALPGAARDRFRVDHVGFVFQQFNLVPYLSVLDNVLLPCRFSALRAARARAASDGDLAHEARRLLEALDLPRALLARPATQLSVGQQQRVAAARALLGRPELVIADEPTSALDAATQQRFIELLLRECEAAQATLLFVSHDRRLAAHFTRELALADLNRAAVLQQEAA
ncbi:MULTISPECIES: ATP-binding cassette domain-containing protein [unclassified Rhizobacter]|uniref:ATP-binding cassette domain-containing protein n=1 Tax=unclassified Rhizobacter TaxID=2640088 RepID=UPI0006F60898|nr:MULTISPECIES: ATP-binding cassette domain-containing protein [unclassified Rhizobacter]KQU79008.1 methionine ABC transporter ATP-binding protein [Rhizobacter sp. Root29]KQW13503.1 methionine ABC transporter ATP-binding protein [Rhizobacter sp. Root1238]KRB06287.1 methionine ABC transporter ATP-binding protein [Rhizobacter sp. Root16D2]